MSVGMLQSRAATAANRNSFRLAQGVLALVAISFLVQIVSPLRLNADSIVLLSMTDSAVHGGGFTLDGQKTVMPPGYPALLAVLVRVGLAWIIH